MTEPLEAGRLCPGFLSTDKYVVEMHIGMDDWSTPEDLVASIRWHLNLPRVEGVTIYRPHGSELHYRLVDDEPKCVYNSWRDRPGYWTSDIAEAWTVVEKFDEVDLHKGPHGWLCRLERGPEGAIQHGEAIRAATAPLAICVAALNAIGVTP